ncbi:hypothetical protein FQN50_007821 [Emmonsiellopsis sp. PD_5]|nr:hypothetical protein FQN50_007821 [Emmonsiellopsis sp. PD_5]
MPKRRATHNKSRWGCASCKKKHIKCDEQLPSCGGCAIRKIPCVYPARPSGTASGLVGESLHDPAPRERRNDDRLSSLDSSPASQQGQSLPPPTKEVSTTCLPLLPSPVTPSPTVFSSTSPSPSHRLLELQLMHRWSVRTWTGLNSSVSNCEALLKTKLPHEALSHSYLLNGIFSLAAIDMSLGDTDTDVSYAANYRCIALEYSNRASKEFRSALSQPNLNAGELHLFYYFATITTVLYFALRQPSASALETIGVAMTLFLGSPRMAQSSLDWLVYSSTSLAVNLQQLPPFLPEMLDLLDDGTRVAVMRMEAVRRLMRDRQSLYDPDKTITQTKYSFVHDHLASSSGGTRGYFMTVIAVGGREFAAAVAEREPLALFILMYWAVLVDRVGREGGMWWVGSIGRDLVKEISGSLAQGDLWGLEDVKEGVRWARRDMGIRRLEEEMSGEPIDLVHNHPYDAYGDNIPEPEPEFEDVDIQSDELENSWNELAALLPGDPRHIPDEKDTKTATDGNEIWDIAPAHYRRLLREQVAQIELAMDSVSPPSTKQFISEVWPNDFATTGKKGSNAGRLSSKLLQRGRATQRMELSAIMKFMEKNPLFYNPNNPDMVYVDHYPPVIFTLAGDHQDHDDECGFFWCPRASVELLSQSADEMIVQDLTLRGAINLQVISEQQEQTGGKVFTAIIRFLNKNLKQSGVGAIGAREPLIPFYLTVTSITTSGASMLQLNVKFAATTAMENHGYFAFIHQTDDLAALWLDTGDCLHFKSLKNLHDQDWTTFLDLPPNIPFNLVQLANNASTDAVTKAIHDASYHWIVATPLFSEKAFKFKLNSFCTLQLRQYLQRTDHKILDVKKVLCVNDFSSLPIMHLYEAIGPLVSADKIVKILSSCGLNDIQQQAAINHSNMLGGFMLIQGPPRTHWLTGTRGNPRAEL